MSFKLPFGPADILLPKTDNEKWACIACDQFTSQPEYWAEADKIAGDAPSALRVIFPEVYLEDGDSAARIAGINAKMREYLDGGVFEEYKNALVYVERTLSSGRTRRGIVGAFALEDYSYEPGAKCLIRPTEGTVLSRIPPRVNIRRDAPLELPHIMIFMDDKRREIIEGIDTAKLTKLYDFDLMLGGGHLCGWLIPEDEQRRIFSGLTALAQESGEEGERMLFAMGDGNHSLATAKAAAPLIGTAEAQYALAELVNIHDEGVDFEPIYRVLFNADVNDLLCALKAEFAGCGGRKVDYVSAAGCGSFFVDGLETEVLQSFIDGYIEAHPAVRVDYIHGEDTVRKLAEQDSTVGFIYGGISRDELFDYVRKNGILPRKSFSVGQARDKRYYMEARRIR